MGCRRWFFHSFAFREVARRPASTGGGSILREEPAIRPVPSTILVLFHVLKLRNLHCPIGKHGGNFELSAHRSNVVPESGHIPIGAPFEARNTPLRNPQQPRQTRLRQAAVKLISSARSSPQALKRGHIFSHLRHE